MKEITIVTAFFDINRADYKTYARTNDHYFEYFSFWARVKNDMIVFCESCNRKKVLAIREEYGLGEKTTIICLDDVFSIEHEMYEKMCKIENDKSFLDFRWKREDPSNLAKYNYIMMMKWYFVSEAANRVRDNTMIAWIDFGFNHGTAYYTKSEEFDFLWEYDFPKKINCFCLKDPKELSLLDTFQFQKDYFIGGSIILPKYMCAEFWKMIRDSMNSLLMLGCMDDDQMLIAMSYKNNPELFEIKICDWFEVFSLCSNRCFTVVKNMSSLRQKNTRRVSIVHRIISKMKWCVLRVIDPNYPYDCNKEYYDRTYERKMRM